MSWLASTPRTGTRSHHPWLATLLVTLLASACGSSGNESQTSDQTASTGHGGTGGATGTGSGAVGGGGGTVTAPPVALLEVHPMDIWAQELPAADANLAITIDGAPVTATGSPVVTVPLTKAASVKIDLSAPEHEPLSVIVTYDGTDALAGASLSAGAEATGQGYTLRHETRTVDGKPMPVHAAYLGLRHKWFSAEGRPARRGNDIVFLTDGEEAWGSVATDLKTAADTIHAATWWWESDFELVRDAATSIYLTDQERWANTMLGILESSPAQKRVLVNQFWGQDSILSWINTDSKLKAYAETANDAFDFMGQANPTSGKFWFEPTPFVFGDRVRAADPGAAKTEFDAEVEIHSTVPARQVDLTEWPISIEVPVASYHQKFMIIDHEVAYIGGMNIKATDWDTSEHLVFEPRRMKYTATVADREAVQSKDALPDLGPRKDYMVRIEGPAAQDADDIFHERWQYQLDQHVDFSQNNSPYDVQRNIAERPGGKQIQVTATLPQPFWEHAIAETWFNAVAQATDYIYIEDQYFRVPMLNDVIAARMAAVPALKLVVITKPINEWTDPGCAWTYASHDLFKTSFPGRYMLLQLRSFDTVVTWGIDETEVRWADMDTHSKMLIVDDKFMSVGSANKNNRGIVYEGELNVAILDVPWVRDARRRIFANILPSGTSATDDSSVWWGQLHDAATWNDSVYAAWDAEGGDISLDGAPLPDQYTPRGFIHSLDFGPVTDCLMESVGKDMTFW